MRSIGKIKIKKLKAIIKAEHDKRQPWERNGYEMTQAIKAQIPDDWYDTWESAWSEIERIISDEIFANCCGKRDDT